MDDVESSGIDVLVVLGNDKDSWSCTNTIHIYRRSRVVKMKNADHNM